jgi:hypothetical protein
MRKQYSVKQIVFWSMVFILALGIVGKMDCDSQQALLEERIQIRDMVKKKQAEDEKIWVAYYQGKYYWSKAEEVAR